MHTFNALSYALSLYLKMIDGGMVFYYKLTPMRMAVYGWK